MYENREEKNFFFFFLRSEKLWINLLFSSMIMASSLVGLVQSHYVMLCEYCLGTTIIFFDISTVDHTRYACTGSCVRQKGRRGSNSEKTMFLYIA